jgi:hypothetical protein
LRFKLSRCSSCVKGERGSVVAKLEQIIRFRAVDHVIQNVASCQNLGVIRIIIINRLIVALKRIVREQLHGKVRLVHDNLRTRDKHGTGVIGQGKGGLIKNFFLNNLRKPYFPVASKEHVVK